MPTLLGRFRGCLLGGAVGDMIGAAVEAESPAYIAKTYASVDAILGTETIEEFTGPPWRVGRCTDDTQMTASVAEWLIASEAPSAERLLARFAGAYQSWRRYGSGTEMILRLYPEQRVHWRELSTAMFPGGSYGNGSAMRVAPIGLSYAGDMAKITSVAIESSRTTHSHPFAYQGAVMQAMAISMAASDESNPTKFLATLRSGLSHFQDLLQDTSKFDRALNGIEDGLARAASCSEMSRVLGTGIEAYEAVPMAIYCFLRHPQSYADVIHQAVFIGGDTDTIASMAGSLSGAHLGEPAIPQQWIAAISDETYTPAAIQQAADRLFTSLSPSPK